MESQIDLMVKQVAINLGVPQPKPQKEQPPKKADVSRKTPTARTPDLKIDTASLKKQSETIRKSGNTSLADGLLRVAELVNVSEDYLLKMHKLMQPASGTKAEYLSLAAVLARDFNAEKNADMIIRMMLRYENEGLLLKN